MFDTSEWKSVWRVVKKKPLPKQPNGTCFRK